jgi:chromosome condensin MukBEF MukE localization factor
MMTMGLVRQGKPEVLFEDLFSDTWKKPIVANFIHTVAQEQADLLAPLPALSCSVGSMKSDADKRRAAQRNKVGTHYMRESNLSMFMHTFADSADDLRVRGDVRRAVLRVAAAADPHDAQRRHLLRERPLRQHAAPGALSTRRRSTRSPRCSRSTRR